jgi:hypothetical protein
VASRTILVLAFLLCVASLAAQVDDGYTKALLHFDGALTDESGKTWTGAGGQSATTTAKFGSGSWEFDGTNGRVYAASATDFEPGTAPMTLDLWVRLDSFTGNPILASRYSSGSTYWYLAQVDGGTIWFGNSTGAGSFVITGTASLTAGVWQHIAVTRDGSDVWRLFLDGIGIGTETSALPLAPTGTTFELGNFNSTQWADGLIDELRFSNGIARWVAPFTPPTAPYGPTAPPSTDAPGPIYFAGAGRIDFADQPGVTYGRDDGYTTLLMHFDHDATGEPGGIYDELGGAWTNGGLGAAAGEVVTIPVKFGTKAYSTDSEATWITAVSYAAADLTSGDWTIEQFVRPSALAVHYLYYDSSTKAATISATGGLHFYDGFQYIGKDAVIATGSWQHTAVTREGNNIRVWLDGNMIEAKTVGGTIASAGANIYVSYGAARDFVVDEIRISKGVARYIATFTPPLAPFYGATIPNLRAR